MNKMIPALLFLLASCAGPQPAYTPEDPLSGAKPPRTYNGFLASLADGWETSDGVLSAPVSAMFRRETAYGAADIVVERYGQGGAALDKEEFVAHLVTGAPPLQSKHAAGGEVLAAYHDLRFTLSERSIGPDDPWKGALTQKWAPPKLSPVEGKRFLVGGEAFRLFRCGKLGAWDVIADYRRAQAAGKVEEFRSTHPPEERRLVSNCFNSFVAHAVAEGRALPPLPRPSLSTLRGMAREEWERGAVMKRERECVVLKDAPGGFWVLRLRAPEQAFELEHATFLAFVGSFRPA
ncbi:hypothetical protein EPO15_01470 [bacterium]|nr:MAG: hypothetical protein EPO15_01470 [bacterium]